MRLVMVVMAMALPVSAWAADEVVGFESGAAARRLSTQDRTRMASLPLQDLVAEREGRYTHLKDDGVLGHWGLDALRARQDVASKPGDLLLRDDVYQTERVIFADLSTGVTMMKLTALPYGDEGDELCYFGKSCFNADGSMMSWMRSRKASLWGPSAQKGDATYGVLLVDGDGTRPRVAFQGVERLQIPVCHPTDPAHAYSTSAEGLVELNLRTQKVERVVKPGVSAWWLKLSPDGKYAGSKPYSRNQFWVVDLKTSQTWTFPLEGPIHDSFRFVPGDTDWIMYWYEKTYRAEGIVLTDFKTGQSVKNDIRFDWNHGDVGRFIGVHTTPYVTDWDEAKRQWGPIRSLLQFGPKWTDSSPDYSDPVQAGGYLQHWPDDQRWAYPTRYTERPWLSEVQCIFAKPFDKGYGRANWFRICTTNFFRGKDRKGNATIILDRPNISFDGTKLLFNSNVFARCEVYLVVLRSPQPPTDVKAAWTAAGCRVSWKPPKYHQEIMGYRVYRSSESGRGFRMITDAPVSPAEYVDGTATTGQVCFYAVRSVEHSKLESGLSDEALATPGPAAVGNRPLRVFVEAERAIAADLKAPAPDAMWVNVDGLASDLYYLWQRRADVPGKASLEVDVPRTGDYTVVARAKGKEGAKFTIAGVTVESPASAGWRWVKSPGAVKLAAGVRTIAIESSKHGSCLDCFYLATDAAFDPKGRIVATTPAAPVLAASAEGGFPKLSWEGTKDPRFWHYNLYVSKTPGLTPGRETLIASPDAPEYLDWQSLPEANYYRVTQVTLDGIESAPSNEVKPAR